MRIPEVVVVTYEAPVDSPDRRSGLRKGRFGWIGWDFAIVWAISTFAARVGGIPASMDVSGGRC